MSDALLSTPVSVHAWNADRSYLAVSPNNSEIHIYKTNNSPDVSKWEVSDILVQHDHYVTAIDWAPKTNRILSCSQDRNAYVWVFEENEWKPTLVLLRTNRAATCCKWSPEENKFAVGTGSKEVCVCYFEMENNWWVSKSIKKGIKSTVTSVSWHPTDNSLVLIGSTDFRCRVMSAHIKNTDGKNANKILFGEIVAEYSSRGWIHDAVYSPSGASIAFVSHDSGITVVDSASGAVSFLRHRDLPFKAVMFLSETVIVVGGYDRTPQFVVKKNDDWEIIAGKGNEQDNKPVSSDAPRNPFEKFGLKKTAVHSFTRHTLPINCIRAFSNDGEKVSKFTTSSLDYRLLFWDVEEMASKFGFSV